MCTHTMGQTIRPCTLQARKESLVKIKAKVSCAFQFQWNEVTKRELSVAKFKNRSFHECYNSDTKNVDQRQLQQETL